MKEMLKEVVLSEKEEVLNKKLIELGNQGLIEQLKTEVEVGISYKEGFTFGEVYDLGIDFNVFREEETNEDLDEKETIDVLRKADSIENIEGVSDEEGREDLITNDLKYLVETEGKEYYAIVRFYFKAKKTRVEE